VFSGYPYGLGLHRVVLVACLDSSGGFEEVCLEKSHSKLNSTCQRIHSKLLTLTFDRGKLITRPLFSLVGNLVRL